MTDIPHVRDECRAQRELFFHLRRGELDESRATSVREHLAGCEDCRRFDEVEAGFDQVLVRHLQRSESAPADLRTRMAAWLGEAGRGGFRRSPARQPWVQGLAAAAILVVGMLIPGAVDRLRGGSQPVLPGVILAEVEWTGTMVDDACDRLGVPLAVQRDCLIEGHHTVLRNHRGEYVAVVAGADVELPVAREDRGSEVRVRGRYDPRAGTLALVSVERL